MKKISVVLPCHNEEANIPALIPEILKNIPKKYSYEIICVDDGSTDNTAQVIETLAKRDKNVKGIFFYKNFGHQQALMAGLRAARGDAIITMDSDFQHPPKTIKTFIDLWEKGHDLIQAKKIEDQTATTFMKFQRLVGYQIWQKITSGIVPAGVSDFRLFSKKISDQIVTSTENEIFLRGLVNLAAKNPKTVFYKVGARKFGKSSYTLKMFINMFIKGFISFSTTPLRLVTVTGIVLFVVISVWTLIDILNSIATGKRIIEGYVTLVVLILAANSILMIYLGILGEYIGTIFKEVKKRPTYFIEKTTNLDKEK